MSANLQRAILLYEQSRYDQADAELRQALADDPNHAYAHALLSLCLCQREQFDAASEEARQAVHLAPDMAFAHYALSYVLNDRNYLAEAEAEIQETIRLDPDDPDWSALHAQILVNQKKWQEALEAAERGLELDPEHVSCTNLRAIAMVRLGRKEEASASIDAALSRNPDNSVTHANKGWACLHQGQAAPALEHFREALRLDPENEWARHGIIEAMKARSTIYSWILRFFLWMSSLSSSLQWGVILVGYFGNRMLSALAKSNPDLAPWIWPIQLIYLVFVLLTWTAGPLSNLLLRLSRFGRLALSAEETLAANLVGTCLFSALFCVIAGLFFNSGATLLGSLVFGFLMIPVAAVFNCPEGWPKKAMIACASVLAFMGIGAWCGLLFTRFAAPSMRAPFLGMLSFFMIGIFASQWVANILMQQRPKR